MRALVTGGSGFVGSAVARAVLAQGLELRVLLRKNSDRRNLQGLDAQIAIGDLRHPDSLRAALQDCQILFHVAADYRLWVPDPASIYANNLEGTRNIMAAALEQGLQRIVYTSSVATLGLCEDGQPADEDTPTSLDKMIGHYKRSKYQAERLVLDWVRERALPAVIVNPSTPVGVGDLKPTPTGQMVVDAARGRMPAYVDTGLNVVDVADVGRGHLLALEKGRVGERYILGESNLSLQEILHVITLHAGVRPPRMRLPRRPLLPLAWLAERTAMLTGRPPALTVDGLRLAAYKMYFSIDKARRELGYRPRPAAAALRGAVDWFGQHGYLGR